MLEHIQYIRWKCRILVYRRVPYLVSLVFCRTEICSFLQISVRFYFFSVTSLQMVVLLQMRCSGFFSFYQFVTENRRNDLKHG